MSEIEDSVLLYVKKMLGILPDYTHFDPDLIGLINAEFAKLHQLGVGPDEVYEISGSEDLWSGFVSDNDELAMVKPFVYLSVRVLFDPPSTSAVLEAYNSKIAELEWRLSVSDDGSVQNEPVS